MHERENEVRYNKFGSKMIIKNYKKWNEMDVYFPKYDWTFTNARYDHFKKGSIKCPYERRFFGIGYLGEGEYRIKKGKGNEIKCQRTWMDMLRRCYDEKSLVKNPSYRGCTVCDEWHNYQNFAKWYEENIYYIENSIMCIDKDILNKGNKIYSPNNCIFVPITINNLFVKCTSSRSKYAIGVGIEKHRYKTSYRASCSDSNGKQIYLGCFDTIRDAFLCYKLNRELVIQTTAEEYKDKIPNRLYQALINYRVEEND